MAEEFNSDKLTPQELAKHLRQPEGETGKKVGKQMNKGNKHICLNSYKVLAPKDNQTILEIGMGNGLFVKDLLQLATGLNYVGLDYSATMVKEASQINEQLIDQGTVSFKEGSIEKLPFKEGSFDAITTTNTLYFWPKPTDNIKELYRVLKPGGKLLVGYRSKDFMDQIELSKYGFEKYESNLVEDVFASGNFASIETSYISEPKLDFDGEEFEMIGVFTIGIKP